MSSDSEISASPLPSLAFSRGSPARGTVARKCREYYLKRLERTATMQKRWSLCEGPSTEISDTDLCSKDSVNDKVDLPGGLTVKDSSDNGSLEGHPLRKCQSSLDIAMDSLRKEISSLIAQDNDLFRQLLSLHDSIAELRERQRSCYSLYPDDEDEENVEDEDQAADGDREDSPSLESLSDNGDLPETSPESTLSCRSSSLSSDSVVHYHYPHKHIPARNRHRLEVSKKRHRAATVASDEPRPLIFVDKSEICFRCRKMAPPYRRARSITNFYWCNEDLDSYDSGIHLQGSHSDSDHEIFV